MPSPTDRIEKQILLRAPQARVWRAISDAAEFGTWFRMALDGRFVAGAILHGSLLVPGYEHIKVEMHVDRVEPQHLVAYRWHPYAVERGRDYSDEPMTLVELRLEARDGGTLLTVVESGFDRLPPSRRDEAFRMNEGGWAQQLQNVERHVAAQ